jgi:hypothetical protein
MKKKELIKLWLWLPYIQLLPVLQTLQITMKPINFDDVVVYIYRQEVTKTKKRYTKLEEMICR